MAFSKHQILKWLTAPIIHSGKVRHSFFIPSNVPNPQNRYDCREMHRLPLEYKMYVKCHTCLYAAAMYTY